MLSERSVDPVQWFFGGAVACFIFADAHSRDLPELAGKVLHAGIIHHKGNLAECEFLIIYQLLDAFDFLKDHKFLKRHGFE